MSSAVDTRLNFELLRCRQAFTLKGVRRRGRCIKVHLVGHLAFGALGNGVLSALYNGNDTRAEKPLPASIPG